MPLSLPSRWRDRRGARDTCAGLFALLHEGRGQPVQALVQPVASSSATSLDIPLPVVETVQTEALSHFGGAHGIRKILLVSEHKKDRIAKLVLAKHAVKLITGGISTLTIIGINHKDEALSILIVVSPQGSDLVLPSDIPHSEADVLVLHSFHVEPNGGDSSHHLTELELVKDSSLHKQGRQTYGIHHNGVGGARG